MATTCMKYAAKVLQRVIRPSIFNWNSLRPFQIHERPYNRTLQLQDCSSFDFDKHSRQCKRLDLYQCLCRSFALEVRRSYLSISHKIAHIGQVSIHFDYVVKSPSSFPKNLSDALERNLTLRLKSSLDDFSLLVNSSLSGDEKYLIAFRNYAMSKSKLISLP